MPTKLEMRRKKFSHQQASSQNSGLNCRNSDLKNAGCLLAGKMLHISQQEDLSVILRQGADTPVY